MYFPHFVTCVMPGQFGLFLTTNPPHDGIITLYTTLSDCQHQR